MAVTCQPAFAGTGWRIFSTEDWASSKPISRISMDTTRPDRYSIRPWPKGWWWSGFCSARWNPSRVTTEDPASERLFTASATTAMDPEARPAASLPQNSSRFSPTPTAPQRTP